MIKFRIFSSRWCSGGNFSGWFIYISQFRSFTQVLNHSFINFIIKKKTAAPPSASNHQIMVLSMVLSSFPNIGLPLNHPFIDGFSMIFHKPSILDTWKALRNAKVFLLLKTQALTNTVRSPS